jgi:hypothetical protein
MQAIHGGQAKNDTIDSQNITVLLRGGMVPQAYVYPGARCFFCHTPPAVAKAVRAKLTARP